MKGLCGDILICKEREREREQEREGERELCESERRFVFSKVREKRPLLKKARLLRVHLADRAQ